MIVMGLDFETSGLSAETDRVLEVGAILWDTSNGGFPLSFISEYCYEDSMKIEEFSREALNQNQINLEVMKKYGKPFKKIFKDLGKDAQAFVAHNGTTFDYLFYKAECKRAGIEPSKKVWIDTSCDLPYHERITTRKLTHLAAEHEFLNPFPHRAIFDVMTMLRIFQRYDPQIAYELAKQPTIVLQAMVSFDEKQKAKDRGYRWKDETKQWLKPFKLSQVLQEKTLANFQVREVEHILPEWA